MNWRDHLFADGLKEAPANKAPRLFFDEFFNAGWRNLVALFRRHLDPPPSARSAEVGFLD